MPSTNISTVTYNATSGILTLTGSNLSTVASSFLLSDFTLSGEKANSYTLSNACTVSGKPTSTKLSIHLSVVDQFAIAGLLNKNGSVAGDGVSNYNLALATGWESNAGTLSTLKINVSNVLAPKLTAVSYNAALGQFSFTGSHLISNANNSINLADFKLSVGASSYSFTGLNDAISNFSANGFSLTVNAADSTAVKGLLTANGTHNSSGSAYKLAASALWDDDSGAAFNALAVTVSHVIVPSITAISYNAAIGVFSISGANFLNPSSSYNFNLADFKLSAGKNSFTFSNSTDSVSHLSANGFDIALSAADQALVNAFVNANGKTTASGVAYQFSAKTHWDNNSGISINNQPVTVKAIPQLSAVSYDNASGTLQLTGSNLNAVNVSDLHIKGDAGTSYTLTAASVVNSIASGNSISILLSSSDQLAVAGLLNNNGLAAADGNKYQLTASSGWISGATGGSSVISVSNAVSPSISTANYDASSGILTVSGTNLTNHGTNTGIKLADFSLVCGSSSYSFNPSRDSVIDLNASGFSIKLNATDQAAVNAFINADGSSSNSGSGYFLKAIANWDSDSGTAITAQPVTASNVSIADSVQTLLDHGLYQPAGLIIDSAGNLLIADMYDNAIKKLNLSSGTLSTLLVGSTSLPDDVKVDRAGNIYIADVGSNDIKEIIAGSQNVVTLLSTGLYEPGNIAVDSSGNLFIADSGNNAIKEIPAGSTTPLTLISTGLNFPGAIAVDSQGNLLVVDSGNNAIKELAVGSNTLTTLLSAGLNDPGAVAVDSLGNIFIADSGNNAIKEIMAGNQAVVTLLSSGLNSPVGLAVDSSGNLFIADTNNADIKEVNLSNQPSITNISYDAAKGILTLSGHNLISTAGAITLSDLSILGDNGASGGMPGSSVLSSSASSNNISIQLSASDQLTLDGLLNQNGKIAADGVSRYQLSASSGWDGNAPAFTSQTINVANVTPPSITSLNIDVSNDKLYFSGANLVAHGSMETALVIQDFTISSGTQSFTVSGGSVSNLSSNGFALSLSSYDLTLLQSLLKSNNGQAVKLSAAAGWDGDNTTAFSSLPVSVFNLTAPISVSAVSYNATSGVLTLSGNNLSALANAYTPADLQISGDGSGSYTLLNSHVITDTLTNSKVDIQLDSADQLAVDGLLNKVGNMAADGKTNYSLSAVSGWLQNALPLTGLGIAVNNVLPPALSTVTYNASSGVFSFTGSNLLDHGLSNGVAVNHITLSNGIGSSFTFNTSYDTVSNLNSNGFTISLSGADLATVNAMLNTNGSGLNSTQAYNINITAAWDSNIGAAISKQAVTVTAAPVTTLLNSSLAFPNANTIAVDSAGDIFIADSANNAIKETLAGSQALLTLLASGLSAPSGIAVDSVGNVYIADTGHNAIKEIVAGSQSIITLDSSGLSLPHGLIVDSNGNLYVDDSGNNAVKEIHAAALPVTSLSTASYNAASGLLTLSGSNFTLQASDYQPAELSLQGNGGASYTLSHNSVVLSALTGSSVSIQLSTGDQLAVDGLLNKNGTQAADGSTAYNLYAASGWDAAALATQVQQVSVANVVNPAINSISYDPVTGVFTISGDNLLKAGNNNGINLQDFTLTTGANSYNFNAGHDSVSQLTANGFTLTLSSADLLSVNKILKSTSASPIAESGYMLSASANWDSGIGAAISNQLVSIASPELTALPTASLVSGASVPASAFISTLTDPNQQAISSYAFRDEGSLGYFTLNGVKQTNSSSWITVTAANLSQLKYVGSSSGSENIDIAASNGLVWSNITTTAVTTLSQQPVLSLLSNAAIIADVSKALLGNTLNYNGMLKILQDVAAKGSVTSSEFQDLQTLVGHFVTSGGTAFAGNQIQVSPYLYDISNKLINGDPANANWTGGALTSVTLGNLAAGSTSVQMNELIGKWFLGSDLPIPTLDNAVTGGTQTGVYVANNLPLYGSSGLPKITDINQNQLGDCYLLACVAEVAKCTPAQIESMITNNGNGTYGVRFYVEGVPTYITVNNQLPESGGVLLANQASDLWASLIEKAYVQLNAEPGATGHTTGSQWTMIDGGGPDPLAQITDQTVAEYDSYLPASNSKNFTNNPAWTALKATFITAINNNMEVVYASNGDSTVNGKQTFISSHMFAVTGYDSSTGDFILYNPWGSISGQRWDTTFEASMAQLQTIGKGSIYIGINGTTTASITNIYIPVIGTTLDGAAAPVSINQLTEGSGQIALATTLFTSFAGQNALHSDNFSNAGQSIGSKDYLYYNATNGGVYYDAHPTQSATGVEIAVVGVNTHPDALTLADFKLLG